MAAGLGRQVRSRPARVHGISLRARGPAALGWALRSIMASSISELGVGEGSRGVNDVTDGGQPRMQSARREKTLCALRCAAAVTPSSSARTADGGTGRPATFLGWYGGRWPDTLVAGGRAGRGRAARERLCSASTRRVDRSETRSRGCLCWLR